MQFPCLAAVEPRGGLGSGHAGQSGQAVGNGGALCLFGAQALCLRVPAVVRLGEGRKEPAGELPGDLRAGLGARHGAEPCVDARRVDADVFGLIGQGAAGDQAAVVPVPFPRFDVQIDGTAVAVAQEVTQLSPPVRVGLCAPLGAELGSDRGCEDGDVGQV